MKKILYLFTILLLLCSSCRTKQSVQEYSTQNDTVRTESKNKKEVTKEERSSSILMAESDTMSSSMIEEEFTIKFDSTGKPTEFHGKKKKILSNQKQKKKTPGTNK